MKLFALTFFFILVGSAFLGSPVVARPFYFDTFMGAGYLSSLSASYSLGGKFGVVPMAAPLKTGIDVSVEIFNGGSFVHTLGFLEYEKKVGEASKRSVDIGVAAGPASARLANYPDMTFSIFGYLSLNHEFDSRTQWLFLLKVGSVTGYFNVGFRAGFKFHL